MASEKPEAEKCRPLEGHYANYFQVGHNAFEFAIDFGQLYVNSPDAHIHTRIITSPSYVKALLQTLSASIGGYEKTFGEIRNAHADAPLATTPEP
jgi:hypothetical protein